VKTWFQCEYEEKRAEAEKGEEIEHFFVTSKSGQSISESDVLRAHITKFPNHMILNYHIGRPWTFGRGPHDERVDLSERGTLRRV